MATKTYTSSTGQKRGAGGTITFTIDGDASDPIPLDATINGIVLNLGIAISLGTGPAVSEVLCNVQDDHNGGSFSTVNRTSSTGPFANFPSVATETFGSSTDLFGLTSWTASSFNSNSTAETFTVRLTHNGSSGVLYADGNQSVTVHFTEAVAAGTVTLTSGTVTLTSGMITL
tara:strand:+ start:290 stop:808 length:519 start_codon:yes stop_codon:yes gene_type:complete